MGLAAVRDRAAARRAARAHRQATTAVEGARLVTDYKPVPPDRVPSARGRRR